MSFSQPCLSPALDGAPAPPTPPPDDPLAGRTTAEPPVDGLKPVVGALGVIPPLSVWTLPCHFGVSVIF